MLVSKWKATAVTLLTAAALASGVSLYAYQGFRPGAEPASPALSHATDDPRADHAELPDARAARIEQLVKQVRQKQAAGDFDGAVSDLRTIETVAAGWRNLLTNLKWPEKADLKLRMLLAGEPPVEKRSAEPGAPDKNNPRSSRMLSAGQPIEGAPAPESSSSEDRLNRLERTVERLVRHLEQTDRSQPAERLNPAAIAKPIAPPPYFAHGEVWKVDAQNKRVDITIGSDDGLVPGHELFVYRVDPLAQSGAKFELLGQIQIVAAFPLQSVAKVISPLRGKVIKEGDRVSARRPSNAVDGISTEAATKK
jgi:hypothetical protein